MVRGTVRVQNSGSKFWGLVNAYRGTTTADAVMHEAEADQPTLAASLRVERRRQVLRPLNSQVREAQVERSEARQPRRVVQAGDQALDALGEQS